MPHTAAGTWSRYFVEPAFNLLLVGLPIGLAYLIVNVVFSVQAPQILLSSYAYVMGVSSLIVGGTGLAVRGRQYFASGGDGADG